MAGWLERAGLTVALAAMLAQPALGAAGGKAGDPARGGAITYAAAGGPGALDPHVAGSLVALEVIHHVFETLVAMDESYNARPMLAATVQVGDAARRFRFTLRPGLRFSTGATLTSADVLASFERYARVSTNVALLEDVVGYDVPDARTFVVRLASSNAMFLDMLKSPTYPLAIVPADQQERPGREVDVVGTGPFMLESWDKDSHLVLRRNPDYVADRSAAGPDGLAGRKTAYLDTVRYDFVAEPAARLAALQGGTADAVANLPPDFASRLGGRDDLATLRVFPYCQLLFVTHAGNGLTAQRLIRQAIQAAVNVDDIIAASGQPARRNASLVYPGSPYHTGDGAEAFYDRRNLDEARALLRQAGYKGEKLILQTNATYSYMRDAILVLAGQLREAGMNTEVQVVDWLTNLTSLRRGTGNWNVTSAGFCTQPLMGPQQWRAQIYADPHIRDLAGLDDAYRRLLASPEFAPRQAAWRRIETLVLGEAYFIKVADLGAVRAYNTRLHGMAPYFFQRFWNTWVN
ncbi:MAG: ABC transporter substrate-binding protein [Acetobacteraceae bacterium]|nr:ABC transporter substrate-binding protein [Acetobacteraceae bacterium]